MEEETKTKLLALDKKSKTFMVETKEIRSINSKGDKRGAIKCCMIGFNYIPEYLKNRKDKEL